MDIGKTLKVSVLAAVMGCAASAAQATNYTINWLNMGPTPYGSSVPNNSVFNLTGLGPVTVTYSLPPVYTDARAQNLDLINGMVVNGPDTYSWTHHEQFATIFSTGPDPLVPVPWRITYTFQSTVPAGRIALGVSGLGRTTSFGGGMTTASVLQNGTFLGDWASGGNYGPTQFNAGNPFSMQNSLSGPGGIDPWWNTPLGVVRIDDPISSLTVDFSQIRGDGVGVNIGYIVPSPGAATLLVLGGLVGLRRRR